MLFPAVGRARQCDRAWCAGHLHSPQTHNSATPLPPHPTHSALHPPPSALYPQVVPLLAGMSGKGVSLVTWASCLAALVGVGLLEQGGAPPGVGDVWSMLSAVAFGLQVFRTEHHARILGNGNNLSLMAVGEQPQCVLQAVPVLQAVLCCRPLLPQLCRTCTHAALACASRAVSGPPSASHCPGPYLPPPTLRSSSTSPLSPLCSAGHHHGLLRRGGSSYAPRGTI